MTVRSREGTGEGRKGEEGRAPGADGACRGKMERSPIGWKPIA